MNANPAALLALISDLYEQAAALQAENAELREALAECTQPDCTPS